MFVGRANELTKLNKMYKTLKFELIVVYGRRRVGKTRLLTEFCRDKNAIFYVANEYNDSLNLEIFSERIMEHFGLPDTIGSFNRWQDALKFLVEHASEEKLILVIDEFPYLSKANQSILSFIQNYVDEYKEKLNMMLILCGSSVSFMEDKVLSNKSPLYGRRTGQLLVEPLDFFDSLKFFPKFLNVDLVKTYGALGGIPQYLLQFNPDESFDVNAVDFLFNKSAYLYSEVDYLLRQEYSNPMVYKSIIDVIANGASRLNEIATKINETTSKTAIYLKSLLELRITQKLIPINEKEKSKKTIYRLKDNYYSYFYKFIGKYDFAIEQELGREIYHSKVKREMNTYLGYVFEEICIDYISRLNKGLKLPLILLKLGKWWGTDARTKQQEEIDIVGLGSEGGIFCECKYRNELVGIGVLNKLIERSMLLQCDQRYYYIFSKIGFSEQLIEVKKNRDDVILINLETMISSIRD